MKKIWQMFISFFKIGAFTFGGGYAMIPIIEEEVVNKRKWITKEEFMALIKEIDSNTIPLTMNLSADKEEKALKECDDFLNKKIVDIRSISPLAVHFIISKLSSSEQIKFIRENIDEIYQNFSVFVVLGTGGIIWCVK